MVGFDCLCGYGVCCLVVLGLFLDCYWWFVGNGFVKFVGVYVVKSVSGCVRWVLRCDGEFI